MIYKVNRHVEFYNANEKTLPKRCKDLKAFLLSAVQMFSSLPKFPKGSVPGSHRNNIFSLFLAKTERKEINLGLESRSAAL